jgi:hypothetical protein
MACGQQIVIKRPNHQHLHTDITDFDSSVNVIINQTILNSASANWNSTFNTVCALSSDWATGGGTYMDRLSAGAYQAILDETSGQLIIPNQLTLGIEDSYFRTDDSFGLVVGGEGRDILLRPNGSEGNEFIFGQDNTLTFPDGSVQSTAFTNSFVHLSGDIMTGGLSAPFLSCNTLYVGASTIYFVDSNGTIINSLKFSDVDHLNSVFSTTSSTSAVWTKFSTISASVILNGGNLGITEIGSLDSQTVLMAGGEQFLELDHLDGTIKIYDKAIIPYSGTLAVYGTLTSTNFLADSVSANNSVVIGNQSIESTDVIKWDSSYTSTNNNSANWSDAFNYVDANRYAHEVDSIADTVPIRDGDGSLYATIHRSIIPSSDWTHMLGAPALSVDNDVLQSFYSIRPKEQSVGNITLYWPTTNGTLLIDASANSWNNTSTIVQTNSSQWSDTTNTIYDSVYTTVNENSAFVWNYQGNDVKSLTSNYEDISTTVKSNSSQWSQMGIVVESDPIFTTWANSNSANFQSVYSVVGANSANWDYQGNDVKTLTANYSSNYTIVNTNSSNWNSVYTSFNNQSASNANINTIVQNNSSTWAIDLDDASVNSFVFSNSATILNVNSVMQSVSSTWGGGGGDSTVDTFVYNNSATILNVDSIVQSNSATLWNYQGTDVKSLTSNWQNTYTTVNSTSSTWGAGGGGAATWELLATNVISSTVTTVDFVGLTGHRKYMFSFEGVYGGVNDTLYLRVSDNNGSTWITSDYMWAIEPIGTYNPVKNDSDTASKLSHYLEQSKARGLYGDIIIVGANDATLHTTYTGIINQWAAGQVGTHYPITIAGRHNGLSAIDAIRFIATGPSGNINGGSIRVYGWNE